MTARTVHNLNITINTETSKLSKRATKFLLSHVVVFHMYIPQVSLKHFFWHACVCRFDGQGHMTRSLEVKMTRCDWTDEEMEYLFFFFLLVIKEKNVTIFSTANNWNTSAPKMFCISNLLKVESRYDEISLELQPARITWSN